ncbi:unnamed protein product [Mucor circinelloides]
MFKGGLAFADQPIITDITYKAFLKEHYLCSNVIYMKKLDKHVVFFEAIIKSNNIQLFRQYFAALFKIFVVKPEFFLEVVMDHNVYMSTYVNILDGARRCYKTMNSLVYLVEIDNLGE